jgi:hypothetical protein
MSAILGWEFRLPHEKEDTLDVVGNVCRARDHQRPLITSWCSIGAALQFLFKIQGAWYSLYT